MGWREVLFGGMGQKPDPANAQMQSGGFMRDYLKNRLNTIGNRDAPLVGDPAKMRAAQIDTRAQDQFRQREMALADQLGRVASGQQAGAGELAVNRQRQQGIAAQMAQAAAARGGMAGLAGRSAARGIGNLSTTSAGMAKEAALQDQSSARGLLAGVLGQGRGADIGLATNQAGFAQQAGLANQAASNQFQLANQAAKLQQMGMDDAAIAQMLGQMYGIDAAELQARLAQEQAQMGQTGIFGDLLQAGGALGGAAIMASDRTLKTEIKDGAEQVDEFLDAIDPAVFHYVEPEVDGSGEFAGIMAQDAEQSAIGRGFVVDTDRGKVLDNRKVISALLASVARLNARVRELEAKG